MPTEAQKRASAKYAKANTKTISIKLNKKTDSDVIEKLDTVQNKNGYIKKLIRKDIEK